MRQRYVSTSRYELLAKLYNLKQIRKNYLTYYDEFQQLILKLEYHENMNHDIICFKVGLNKEISSCMTIHKFETIEEIFQVALEIERDSKRGKLTNQRDTHLPTLRGWGHKPSEFPNRRNVILRERKLYYLGEEEGLEYENDKKAQEGEGSEEGEQEGEDNKDP
ncbi:hypothetical protein BC332_28037 [Capsicum chinense]|nr:hypothetical protein BC332_28037 [Capsicum chinense]